MRHLYDMIIIGGGRADIRQHCMLPEPVWRHWYLKNYQQADRWH